MHACPAGCMTSQLFKKINSLFLAGRNGSFLQSKLLGQSGVRIQLGANSYQNENILGGPAEFTVQITLKPIYKRAKKHKHFFKSEKGANIKPNAGLFAVWSWHFEKWCAYFDTNFYHQLINFGLLFEFVRNSA